MQLEEPWKLMKNKICKSSLYTLYQLFNGFGLYSLSNNPTSLALLSINLFFPIFSVIAV